MIACKRFKGRHTADNIHQVYQETTSCFDITGKIATVTTDNASNILKAFDLPGFTHSDVPSNANSTDSDDDYEEDGDTVKAVTLDEEEMEPLSKHLPCFAHTLQLVIHDGFKQAGSIGKVIAKASKIVSRVRHSTHASDILEGEKRLQAIVTRWNSQLKMILISMLRLWKRPYGRPQSLVLLE